jgi:hypothetical protein
VLPTGAFFAAKHWPEVLKKQNIFQLRHLARRRARFLQ